MKHSTDSDGVLARLREGTGSRSDTELARKLGVSQQSISSAKTKDRVPDAWIRLAAEKFLLSADWLLFGVGGKRLDHTGMRGVVRRRAETAGEAVSAAAPGPDICGPESNGLQVLASHEGELVMVPMVKARISAGGGSFETSASIERHYAFRMEFLRRKGQPLQMVLMRVDGDSMAPEIHNNDCVLIDKSQNAPRPGGTYAVSVEDMIYLKVVNAEPGKLVLSSHNPLYAPLRVDMREQLESTVRIIGRVVWLGREFF